MISHRCSERGATFNKLESKRNPRRTDFRYALINWLAIVAGEKTKGEHRLQKIRLDLSRLSSHLFRERMQWLSREAIIAILVIITARKFILDPRET